MSLKRLTQADLELILPWRNAPAVRRAMYSHHAISLDEHRAWFERLQQDPSRRWYLFHDETGAAQGVVYFTEIDAEQGTAFWGFYARPDAPSGTGLQMELAALNLAFTELGLHKLNCEVLASNSAVVNMHKKVGFTEEGRFREQHHDGANRIDIIRLGLLASEWPERRERLRARIIQLAELKGNPPHQISQHRILMLSDVTSWINPYLLDLQMDWEAQGHRVTWAHDLAEAQATLDSPPKHDDDPPARSFCFCLSFSQILPSAFRARFQHTLVVHESELPQGKGWSPLTWQILEGQQRIPVTLIEAAERVDSGVIYAQRWLEFQGHELIDELRAGQAEATHDHCRWFIDEYPHSAEQGRAQQGEESFYPRRRLEDSRLDPKLPLAEQFDLLRVVDNERYPAFFECRGREYRLTVIGYEQTLL